MKKIRQLINRAKSIIDYQKAVKMADTEHAKDGERYYVLGGSTDGMLLVMNRSTLKKLKKEGRIDYSISVLTLEKKSFYHTPYSNGTGELTPADIVYKRKQFFRWRAACYERCRRLKK